MNQEIIKIEQEQKGIAEQVNSLSIVNQETYETGASLKISLFSVRKRIKVFFDPMITKAKEAYVEIRETRDKYLKPTEALEETIKGKLRVYERQMEKEAEEARRKAEAEKQKAIDEENKRRKEEAEQKAKDEAEVMGLDEKEVEVEKVEEATEEDVEVKQPQATISKVPGLGIRKAWKWKIVDEKKIPKKYWVLNEVMINQEVRNNKENTGIPGIETFEV